MNKEEIIALLKEVVSIEVVTTYEYSGSLEGYKDSSRIKLLIDGDEISEIYLP